MKKERRLVSGDNSINIQAESVRLVFPSLQADIANNPMAALDESLHFIGGLKKSSFLKEASEALKVLYRIYNHDYKEKISNRLLASLTEEFALVQMDMGDVVGNEYSAVSLFLKASQLWKKADQIYNSLFSMHMLGVSAGIAGRNDRAIKLYEICRRNIPNSSRFKPLYAHVTRDLGIALNRSENYEQAFRLLTESRNITKHWNSEFNFGLDSQKLAIAAAGCGNYDFSLYLLDEASDILDTKDDLSYVKNLNAKHFFAVKSGEKDMAKNLYNEIIEICNYRNLSHQKRVLITQSNTGKTC